MNFELSEEQQLFQKSVHAWVDERFPKARARELEQREYEYPEDLWQQMAEAGFHAVGVDEKYGGQGGDVVTQVILARELARNLAGLAWIWGVSSFAGAKSVGLYGTDEQKQRFLPPLARGDLRFSIAVTEPTGGTDLLGAMRTTAEKVDGGWKLNGQKVWSTGAYVADYLLLLARSDSDVTKRTEGTTLFLVPRPAEGLDVRLIPKLGMKAFGSCEVFLDDVFVPDENVLGEQGRAWSQLVGTLNNERIILAALACGVIDGVLEDAVAYLKDRTAFGQPIGQFQSLQHYVADITMWQKQAELLTHNAAWLQSQERPCATEALMAKVVASEYAVQAADLGIQMLGGMGYSLETDMQRYWRDARVWRIGPISSEMSRNLIAESHQLPRSF